MTAQELVEPFGVAPSTAASKAAQIKKMFKINYFNSEWCLPSRMDNNMGLWMVEVNGLLVDARYLSPKLQKICYARGLIPYVYAERE